MTAVLAVIAAALVVAVLVLVCAAAMLWAAYGPQGFWVMAWLVTVFAVVTGAVLAIAALQPKGDGDG